MVSPVIVAVATLLGLVLLVAPMLGLTLVGARTEAGTPPAVSDDSE